MVDETSEAPVMRTLRDRARAKLNANGGWGIAILGGFLAFVVSYAVNGLVQHGTGLMAFQDWLEALRAGRMSLPVFEDKVFAAAPQLLAGASGSLFIGYLLTAAFAFGLTVLAVSVMREGARVGQVFTGFRCLWRVVWLKALAEMYVFCWTLLFVVPGVRAAFSYALKYFIQTDHPDWSARECLAESKRLMAGNRFRYFTLWASFIGWWLLCAVTFGLALFFVLPYYRTAQAAFYEDLLDRE